MLIQQLSPWNSDISWREKKANRFGLGTQETSQLKWNNKWSWQGHCTLDNLQFGNNRNAWTQSNKIWHHFSFWVKVKLNNNQKWPCLVSLYKLGNFLNHSPARFLESRPKWFLLVPGGWSRQQDSFLIKKNKKKQLSWPTARHRSVWVEQQQQQRNQSLDEKTKLLIVVKEREKRKKRNVQNLVDWTLAYTHSLASGQKTEARRMLTAGSWWEKSNKQALHLRLKDRWDTKREKSYSQYRHCWTGAEMVTLLREGALIGRTRWQEAKLTGQTGSVKEKHLSNSDRDGR